MLLWAEVYFLVSLRKRCPYSELSWSVLSHIRTEYGEVLRDTSRMRENTDQNNSEYGQLLRSVYYKVYFHVLDRFHTSCQGAFKYQTISQQRFL